MEASVIDTFPVKRIAAMAARTMGNPEEEATELRPQARGDLRESLHALGEGEALA